MKIKILTEENELFTPEDDITFQVVRDIDNKGMSGVAALPVLYIIGGPVIMNTEVLEHYYDGIDPDKWSFGEMDGDIRFDFTKWKCPIEVWSAAFYYRIIPVPMNSPDDESHPFRIMIMYTELEKVE